MDDNLAEGEQWIDEHYDSPLGSTILPHDLVKDGNAIGTLVLIIVVALVLIILLFGIAVFIDCRQQKLINGAPQRRLMKLKFPTFGRNIEGDRDTIADKIDIESSSSSTVVV